MEQVMAARINVKQLTGPRFSPKESLSTFGIYILFTWPNSFTYCSPVKQTIFGPTHVPPLRSSNYVSLISGCRLLISQSDDNLSLAKLWIVTVGPTSGLKMLSLTRFIIVPAFLFLIASNKKDLWCAHTNLLYLYHVEKLRLHVCSLTQLSRILQG